MSKLPQRILDEFKKMKGAAVITTVDKSGNPNSIYATCVSVYQDEKFLVADNFFDKTFKNLTGGCKGGFLFITDEDKAYQLKGNYAYYTDGEYFNDMKKWNPENLPGKGVGVLEIHEIYSGSEKID